MRVSEPDKRTRSSQKMFPEVTRVIKLDLFPLFDFYGITCPDHAFLCRVVQSEECRDIGRPREIKKSSRRAMILHQGQPLEIVIAVRNVIQEVGGFAFKNPQNPLFLQR